MAKGLLEDCDGVGRQVPTSSWGFRGQTHKKTTKKKGGVGHLQKRDMSMTWVRKKSKGKKEKKRSGTSDRQRLVGKSSLLEVLRCGGWKKKTKTYVWA